MFLIADVGITVMTVNGERSFTQNNAQDLKRIMNEEKASRQRAKRIARGEPLELP